MPSDARYSCGRILSDVDDLIGYHPKIKSPGAGKPASNTKPLLHACTVLSYAAWEVYVEDLLLEAVPYIQGSRRYVPPKLREKIATSKRVRDDPWKLAGTLWREEVLRSVRGISIGDAGTWGMNTANSKNVNEAFEIVFGERLLDRCSWRGQSATSNKRYIDQLVARRGSIVHRGDLQRGDGGLNLSLVRNWAKWVGSLADRVDELAASALEALTGSAPW